MSQRSRMKELTQHLHRARHNPEMEAMRQLLALLLDDVKAKLLNSTPEQTVRLQGEGSAYTSLLRMIERPVERITNGPE